MTTLPNFDVLRGNYPDGDPNTVKSNIGGKVDADWITNTCAIRLSRAFNYSGVHIPTKFDGLSVLSGADGMWYAYRMRELKKWIELTFGEPNIVKVEPANGHITRESFASTHGIVAFDIRFDDASGHLDLWDGTRYIHQSADPRDYFALATKVVLWELALK
jgi:hypothetical protein